MLPTMSKACEHTCKFLIERCQRRDSFHKEQYGFTRRRSTIDALNIVCGISDLCRRTGLVCVLVVLDIKNAFNILSWRRILREAEERRLPGRLLRILDDYLSDRSMVAHCRDGVVKRRVYAGMLQGSVRGPLIWNLLYDGLLKALDPIKDVDAIAIVDDLALIITMRDQQEIGDRVRGLVKLVTDRCVDTGLRLAREKTEVILLTAKRVPKVFNLDVSGEEITTKEAVKYLGVFLDNARRCSFHLEQACDKTESFVGIIWSLLPNVNGPPDSVRIGMIRNKEILVRAQRAALVRTSTVYRTVLHGALCVVKGSMPIDIKERLRWKGYEAKRRFGEEAYAYVEKCKAIKQEAEDMWRIEWAFYNLCNWTRRLIGG